MDKNLEEMHAAQEALELILKGLKPLKEECISDILSNCRINLLSKSEILDSAIDEIKRINKCGEAAKQAYNRKYPDDMSWQPCPKCHKITRGTYVGSLFLKDEGEFESWKYLCSCGNKFSHLNKIG